MQRIMGAILIIFASGGIGVTKGIELQKYLRELEQLKQIFWMLKREIQYTKAPFSEAFSHIGRRMEGAQGEWLLYLARQIEEKAGATFFQSVSYTHLDVYKRQELISSGIPWCTSGSMWYGRPARTIPR